MFAKQGYEYCQCGCGQKAPIAPRNIVSQGIKKGEPYKYIHGHNGRVRETISDNIAGSYVVQKNGCWKWRHSLISTGYGILQSNGVQVLAHRYMHELQNGPISPGKSLHHKCGNNDPVPEQEVRRHLCGSTVELLGQRLQRKRGRPLCHHDGRRNMQNARQPRGGGGGIAADNCVLFLWTTYPMLKEAIKVIEAWGFTYKSIAFQWVKQNRSGNGFFFGLGRWTRGNTEPCLIAVKGKPKRISAGVSQLVFSPLRKHSQKPDEVRDRIVELMGDVPRIELFARNTAAGWDSWGNEVPAAAEMEVDHDNRPESRGAQSSRA